MKFSLLWSAVKHTSGHFPTVIAFYSFSSDIEKGVVSSFAAIGTLEEQTVVLQSIFFCFHIQPLSNQLAVSKLSKLRHASNG